MAFKRPRRSTAASRAKRPRFGCRKAVRMSRPVRAANRVHYFKRKSQAALYTGNAAGSDLYGGAYYYLGGANGFGDFTALFDRYKIIAVKTTFVWNDMLSNSTIAARSNAYPTVHTLIDYDDANAPTSLNGFLVNGRVRSHHMGPNRNVCSVYFRPKTKIMLWSEGALTDQASGIQGPNNWKDCDYTNITHYGLKWCIENLGTNNEITVYHTYYLAFRDSL